jgi:NitT/TauT family transport system ATP-binding protein
MTVQRRGAAVEIDHLRKEFGSSDASVVAIDDVSLNIAPGEFVCVVGPSGCGKSTLLRILAGLDFATGGTIKIDDAGWPVGNAMVFQDSGLFPWMNVEKNVAFGLMTRAVPRAEIGARVEAALKLVGLTKFRHHYPHQLSGGMRQRGAIARAFVTNPGMLLMDEPFAALDAQTREILQRELLRIHGETGKTILFVTHDLDEAIYLSDRVIVLGAKPGRIKATLPVPFPRPRAELPLLRGEPAFQEMRTRMWELIRTPSSVAA